jgi:succinate dehydrogenase/fumarate reductase flavoprotein subunit
MKRTDDTDIIVVGAGVAGAAAALEAASRGCAVLGVDAAPGFGGTARLAGGGMCIPGTSMQRERGIKDSPELAMSDFVANGGSFDPEWARAYFERGSRDLFEWLRCIGVEFAHLKHFEGDSVPRFHRPLGGGSGLMATLWEYGRRYALDRSWRFGLRLVDLIVEDGIAAGVVCRNVEGEHVRFHAKAVIVATGGFAANLALIREHAHALRNAPRILAGGGPGAHGEGLGILRRHGARIDYLQDFYCYATGVPDYADPAGLRGVVLRGMTGWVWLNRAGERFHDESQMISGNVATPRLLAQEGVTGWSIFDSAMVGDVFVDDHYVPPGSESEKEAAIRHLTHSSHAWKADTLEELFLRSGISVEGGAATIRKWNERLRSGAEYDPLTGRKLSGLKALEKPPFYAVQFFPIGRKAMGGIQTDMQCRVRRESGGIIPGLYGAGELCGMAGGHIGGSRPLEGMMVGPSCLSGRIAGGSAAEWVRNNA